MNVCYVDIETTTWFNQPEIEALPSREMQLSAMEFGIAVTGYADGAEPRVWLAHEAMELYHHLESFDLVAGWNILAFDLPIIARAAGLSPVGFPRCYDLFDIIRTITGRWYKLEDIAQANLGRGKTGDGLQAARWLAEGGQDNIYKAVQYCLNDVKLETQIGELAREGGAIMLPGLKKFGQEKEMLLKINLEKQRYTLEAGW